MIRVICTLYGSKLRCPHPLETESSSNLYSAMPADLYTGCLRRSGTLRHSSGPRGHAVTAHHGGAHVFEVPEHFDRLVVARVTPLHEGRHRADSQHSTIVDMSPTPNTIPYVRSHQSVPSSLGVRNGSNTWRWSNVRTDDPTRSTVTCWCLVALCIRAVRRAFNSRSMVIALRTVAPMRTHDPQHGPTRETDPHPSQSLRHSIRPTHHG